MSYPFLKRAAQNRSIVSNSFATVKTLLFEWMNSKLFTSLPDLTDGQSGQLHQTSIGCTRRPIVAEGVHQLHQTSSSNTGRLKLHQTSIGCTKREVPAPGV